MRDVILITVDSLRADHCGHWGYHRDTTPTLDRMADRGLSFENAISPGPSTPESLPAIMTGSHPVERGGEPDSQFVTRRASIHGHLCARLTLAERFKAAGYDTAGFSPNPYTSRFFGFDQGFDQYEDFIGGSRERLYQGLLDGVLEGTPLAGLLPARILLNWVQREEVFKQWESFYDRIIGWVEEADPPFFLWVLLMDTHDPYLVPDEYRTQSRWATYHANWRLWRQGHEPPLSRQTHDRLVRAYNDSITYADAFLERLIADLQGDPIIAVHGDHGEAFGEHGTYGHHQRLYEENIHVPLVIDGVAPETIQAPVSLDLIPNLLSNIVTGQHPPLDSSPARARTLDGERSALRGRNWKYLDGPGGETTYNLSEDPGEQRDQLAEGLSDCCRQLITQWSESAAERKRIATAVAEGVADA